MHRSNHRKQNQYTYNQDLQEDNHAQEHKMYPGNPLGEENPQPFTISEYPCNHVNASLGMPLANT